MSKNSIIIIVVIIIIGAVFYFQRDNSVSAPTLTEEASQEESQETPQEAFQEIQIIDSEKQPPQEKSVTENIPQKETTLTEKIITYSNSGYSPSVINIKVGETVIFKNDSSRDMWTASASHPTHRVYPGSDIKKCSSAPAGVIFDSCRGTRAGDSWVFQFNEAGTWRYHNHLNASQTGTVIVK